MIDTNLLVYAFYPEVPQHRAARWLLDQAQEEKVSLCASSQVLAEFYAVVTNPKRVSPALDSKAALQRIDEIRSLPGLILLPLPLDVVDRWMALIRRHPVTRQHIFDVQLVATMLANGVTRLYTFNVKDFLAFSEITVIEPKVPEQAASSDNDNPALDNNGTD
ncbi:MAG: type II toxin-antitoxin system VapC family toxin [Candidatus Binatia bacterium]